MLIIIPKSKNAAQHWTKASKDNSKYQQISTSLFALNNTNSYQTGINNEYSYFHQGYIRDKQNRTTEKAIDNITGNINTTSLTSALAQLKGRFFLGIHNSKTDVFLAAIDKIGKKDCYYFNNEDELIVSDSLKEIQNTVNGKLTINPQAIFNYFYFHCIPSPLTIFNEIKKLEPGSCLKLENGKITSALYWQPQFRHTSSKNIPEQSAELKQKLKKAITNSNPDSSSASFLSGGLDSSTITGMFSSIMPEKADAFTMGFEEAGYDETEFAEAAAQHFNVNLNHYYVTPQDVANAFSHVTQACDEPFGNSSIIPTYLCAKFAKDQGKTMLLAGDGGDELFAGNERYLRQLTFNHYDKIPSLLKTTLLEPLFLKAPLIPKLPVLRKISRYIEQAKVPMPERMETYNLLNQFPHEAMFNSDFLQKIDTSAPVKAIEETYKVDTNADFLQQMLYSDWKFTLADNDLKKVNTACRLAGINVEYPFLDEDVVEFSSQIPPNLLIKNNTLRYFYKEAIKDFLPDEIINKKKHGFGLPFGEWLKKSPELQNHIYKNLNNFKSRNILNENFVDEIIDKHRTQHAGYYGVFVWVIAVLEEWLYANVDTQQLN